MPLVWLYCPASNRGLTAIVTYLVRILLEKIYIYILSNLSLHLYVSHVCKWSFQFHLKQFADESLHRSRPFPSTFPRGDLKSL